MCASQTEYFRSRLSRLEKGEVTYHFINGFCTDGVNDVGEE